LVFFGILELMSDEFDIFNPGKNTISLKKITKNLQLSRQKTVRILAFFDQKAKNNKNKSSGFYAEIINNSVHLNCPRLKELTDEYTKKQLKIISGQTPDSYRDKLRPKEEEVDKEVDNSKENNKKKVKKRYGERVKLTEDEHKRLVIDYGEKFISDLIAEMNDYCAIHGKVYHDHNLALRNWTRKRGIEKLTKENNTLICTECDREVNIPRGYDENFEFKCSSCGKRLIKKRSE